MSPFDYQLDQILLAVLMSFRFGAFFAAMPVLGEFNPPVLVRMILPVAIAALLAPLVPQRPDVLVASSALAFLLAVVTEVLVGVIMGFSIHVLFMLANVAGEVAGQQIGFSIASVFDPNLGHSALLGFFLRLFLVLLFFAADVHHVFIWTLAKSYESVPPGSAFFPLSETVPGFVKLFGALYLMAFRFVLPVIVTIFLAHVMVGIVSVTAPQMNFYFNVALSLNVVFGMAIIVVSFGLMFRFFSEGTTFLRDFLRMYFLAA